MQNSQWHMAGCRWTLTYRSRVGNRRHDDVDDAGLTTWDLADIYGPAEDIIGDFRHRLLGLKGKEELDRIFPQPGRITRR